jgi:phosphoribosylformylglycinamidine cyclo-ligase
VTTYAEAGIHLDEARRTSARLGDIVARARRAGVLADVGAFGGMFRLGAAGELRDPVLVASTDGIGTKVKVASALGRYDGLGADIVNHCLNDIAVQGAMPLFFLDYLALHHADPELVTTLVTSVAEACAASGFSLLGGETAEMPDVYSPGEFDVAGFIVGVLDRAEIGANGAPAAGDVLLGLPSVGLHTNGYSLARRALPFETWSRYDSELGMTIGDALLIPHR